MNQYRKTPRAKFIDYDFGNYFITICTKDRQQYFGKIENGIMKLSAIGKFLDSQLSRYNDFCKNIEIPIYVIMPNHLHAVICIKSKAADSTSDINLYQRAPNPSLRCDPTYQRLVPTLSRYISSLKGSVTKYAISKGIVFEWQQRYHDHLIRGNDDARNIHEYILNNVTRWEYDCFNPNQKVGD